MKPLGSSRGCPPSKPKACQIVAIRRLSAATPSDRSRNGPADPGGVAPFWHPFGMHRSYRRPTRGLRSAATPGYSLPTLRVENENESRWAVAGVEEVARVIID